MERRREPNVLHCSHGRTHGPLPHHYSRSFKVPITFPIVVGWWWWSLSVSYCLPLCEHHRSSTVTLTNLPWTLISFGTALTFSFSSSSQLLFDLYRIVTSLMRSSIKRSGEGTNLPVAFTMNFNGSAHKDALQPNIQGMIVVYQISSSHGKKNSFVIRLNTICKMWYISPGNIPRQKEE